MKQKTLRQMLALVLVVMMLLPNIAFPTFAANNATWVIESKENVEPNSTVELYVKLESNVDCAGLTADFSTTQNWLTLDTVEAVGDFAQATKWTGFVGTSYNHHVALTTVSALNETIVANQNLLKLTLTVADNASGDAYVKLDLSECYDDDTDDIECTVTGGTISIKSSTPTYPTVNDPVANIIDKDGTTEKGSYSSVKSAAESTYLADGDTIKLVANSTETDTVTITAGKAITLNLGGKALTGNVVNLGTLTLENGTVNGQVASGGTLNINDTRVYINGGIVAAGTTNINAVNVKRTTTYSDNGTDYTAAVVAMSNNTKVNITGGSFESTVGAAVEESGNATVTITGGSFKGKDGTKENALSGCTAADGHTLVAVGSTGWYQVLKNYGVTVTLDKAEYQVGDEVTATIAVTGMKDKNLRDFQFKLDKYDNLKLDGETEITVLPDVTTTIGTSEYNDSKLAFSLSSKDETLNVTSDAYTLAKVKFTAEKPAPPTKGDCGVATVELSDVYVSTTEAQTELNPTSTSISATADIHVKHTVTVSIQNSAAASVNTDVLNLDPGYSGNISAMQTVQLYKQGEVLKYIDPMGKKIATVSDPSKLFKLADGYEWGDGNMFVYSYNDVDTGEPKVVYYKDISKLMEDIPCGDRQASLNPVAIEKNISWTNNEGYSFAATTETGTLPATYTVESGTVTFKVTPNDANTTIGSVYYYFDNDTTNTTNATDNGDGTYSIDFSKFSKFDNITVKAEATGYYTVKLSGGDTATLSSKQEGVNITDNSITLYVKKDATNALYTDSSFSKSLTDPITVTAKVGYRLDDSNGVAQWTTSDGQSTYLNTIDTLSGVTSNVVLTPKTIKTYEVKFVYGENGAQTSNTQIGVTQIIDTGKTATAPTDPTAEDGYKFVGWYVGDTEVENVASYSITADTTFTAKFEKITHTFSVPKNNAYTVNVTDKTTGQELTGTTSKDGLSTNYTVTYGQQIKVTVTAVGDNYLKSVTVNGTPSSGITGNSYTTSFTVGNNEPTISIDTDKTYTVTFNAGDHGNFGTNGEGQTITTKTISVKKDATLSASDFPTVYANSGWEFKAWSPEYNDTGITEATTFTATYKQKTITITTTVNSGTATTDTNHKYGEAYTIAKVASDSTNGYTVITGDPIVKCGETMITLSYENGVWTVPAASVTGDLSVSYDQISVSKLIIVDGKEGYKAAPAGKNLVILQTEQLSSGYLMYGTESTFYYSARYGGYAAFIDASVAVVGNTNDAAVLAGITKLEGTVNDYVVPYSGEKYGDISGNGTVTSVDAGIVNDVLHGGITNISDLARLMMDVVNVAATDAESFDVNSETIYPVVTSQDIKAILNLAVGLPAGGNSNAGGVESNT